MSQVNSLGAPANRLKLGTAIRDGVFWIGVSKGITQLLSWAVTILLARILAPDDYGLMGMAGAYIALLVLFNEFGLGAAIIQVKDISEDDINNIFWLVLLVNGVLCSLTAAVAPFVSQFFNEPRLTLIIRVMSLSFLVSGISLIPSFMLTRNMSFNKRAIAECCGSATGAVVAMTCAVQGLGVWSLVFGSLALEVTKNAMYFFFHPWIPRFAFSPMNISKLVSFGLKVAAARMFWYLYNNADFVVGGKLLGKVSLGYYSLALQLASMPLDKIVSIVAQVAFPAMSQVQADNQLLRKYLFQFIRWTAFVTFPMFFGLLTVCDLAVPLILTDKWLPILLPLKILCFVSAFKAISAIYGPVLLAKGNAGLMGLNNAVMAVVLTCSFYVGAQYGLDGLAYAWLVFPLLFCVTSYVSLRSIEATILDLLKAVKHPIAATVLMSLFTELAQHVALADLGLAEKLVGTIVVGAATYCGYFYLFNKELFLETRALLTRRG
jgi:teichuronic acid exporter